jgi:hypothetical protein
MVRHDKLIREKQMMHFYCSDSFRELIKADTSEGCLGVMRPEHVKNQHNETYQYVYKINYKIIAQIALHNVRMLETTKTNISSCS